MDPHHYSIQNAAILIHFIIFRATGTDGHGIVDRFFLISFENSTAA